jgi:hypothetical protein
LSSDRQCVGDVAERLISISVLQDTQQSNAAEILIYQMLLLILEFGDQLMNMVPLNTLAILPKFCEL